MPDVTASRTLVKSAPELWTECSDADSLSRHLDPFGDIRITRLEPETAVAWEGELASGTVRLEPSGWGTRVVLTATPAPTPVSAPLHRSPEPEAEVEPALEIEPVIEAEGGLETPSELPTPRRPSFFARLFGRLRGQAPAAELVEAAESEAVKAPAPESDALEPVAVVPASFPAAEFDTSSPESPESPESSSPDSPDPEAVLMAALDSLGQAHHRPYSRA